ncbi:hypothetical protein DHW03_04705 [Pedobacter yonginense]|uniref:Response regulatory domain-containing protein n=1 Tax=Pedobacter yonginense TaxID=651869 RepID=A0A317ETI2_9SPHI|nr:response regulator [Pedobacter yonginense]PWS29129.1 hypothetical protein DHW03_04705 [Pedobacter yonginense]
MTTNLKILIADDSELMRIVMRGFFTKLLISPEIKQTSSLSETFELLKGETFDLLILDINMPDGDSSPKTVQEIHAMQPDLKVCMFSSNDKALFAHSYYEAGAVGFIQKDENMNASTTELVDQLFAS